MSNLDKSILIDKKCKFCPRTQSEATKIMESSSKSLKNQTNILKVFNKNRATRNY